MTEEPDFQRLDPAVKTAWVLGRLVGTLILGGGALVADLTWASRQPWWFLPPGVAGGAIAGLKLLLTIVMPPLAYRVWRYAVRGHDVLMRYGVVWRVTRSVPRLRIQHVDIEAGPIDRSLGLVNLTLYTAGTGDADATIPGLKPDVAEALRETLLA